MRISQGGHDVPTDKLVSRFPRTLANLQAAIRDLPHIFIYDNDDLSMPFRQVAVFQNGRRVSLQEPVSKWLKPLLPPRSSGKMG
jgi:predicted ABC-type ATPase